VEICKRLRPRGCRNVRTGCTCGADDALARLPIHEADGPTCRAGLRAIGASRAASIISYIRLSSAFHRGPAGVGVVGGPPGSELAK